MSIITSLRKASGKSLKIAFSSNAELIFVQREKREQGSIR